MNRGEYPKGTASQTTPLRPRLPRAMLAGWLCEGKCPMTTLLRKLLVLAVVGAVLVLASIYEVVRWLTHLGVPEMAGRVSERHLTGTTVAIVVALVFLLRSDRRRYERPDEPPYWQYRPGPRRYRDWWGRR
jgi:hypothetical protein